MVNTRRSETVSSARHRPLSNRVKVSSGGDTSDSRDSSDEEVSQESESWSSQRRGWLQTTIPTTGHSGRVRELRNRFVCTTQERGYSRRSEMNHGHRRREYSTREVADDSDDLLEDIDQDSSAFIFTPRSNRRHDRVDRNSDRDRRYHMRAKSSFPCTRRKPRKLHREESHEDRGGENQRNGESESKPRSREGLRPLKRECYVDSPYSQEIVNSSDEKPFATTEIRRSTRQRKFKYNTFNTSWITEHQMIRGYPTYKRESISDHEEDSKESREEQRERIAGDQNSENMIDNSVNGIDMSRKKNEPSEACGVTKKYVYEYLTRRSVNKPQVNGTNSTKEQPNGSITEDANQGVDNLDTTRESNESRNERTNRESNHDVDGQENVTEEEERGVDEAEDGDEESQQAPLVRTSRRRRRTVIRYTTSPVQTRRNNRKICDSDSTTEERREHRSPKYKLRQRKPKPKQIKDREEADVRRRSTRMRRRRTGRRRRDSSSDSSSTSTDDQMPRVVQAVATGNSSMQLKPTRNRANTPPREKAITTKDCAIVPINPETLDSSVTFSSIGGLEEQVRSLREMVILPMLYPEIFQRFSMKPPKGVLFHGSPGTGKTLIAKALANECSFGKRKVSFFMRKGADLLSKWIGQTEKQMALLFEQAAQLAPSIIFFDELDGLVPARTGRQEQVHISVVASLLALMDGLDSKRGEVIVIGATNRPDAIDPALRRPGRFDREIYFPIPSAKQREEILRLIVSEWPEKPSNELLSAMVERCAGYCGADLRALCTETVLRGVRRTYPQIYESEHRLLIETANIKVQKCDFLTAAASIMPTKARGAPVHIPAPLPVIVEPLLKHHVDAAMVVLSRSFPVSCVDNKYTSLHTFSNTARLLITGACSQLVGTALLHHMEHITSLSLDIASLHSTSTLTPEEACLQVLSEARKSASCIVFLPRIELWWDTVNESVIALLLQQAAVCPPKSSHSMQSVLMLATTEVTSEDLPESLTSIFNKYRNEIIHIENPKSTERYDFFRPLMLDTVTRPPVCSAENVPKVHESLPRAPTPPPPPLSPAAQRKVYEKEEETLIELRIFLRDVCKKLARNKAFFMFTKPVNLEEVPDYLDIVQEPMDLETMMTKVDLHRYSSAQEFLGDVDLIQTNALKYNPDTTPADKQIRHRACWFRDYAYALIKAEMDTDFEDNCRKIAKRRSERKTSDPYQYLPPHIRALAEEDNMPAKSENKSREQIGETSLDKSSKEASANNTTGENTNSGTATPTDSSKVNTPQRKRRVPAWARGYLHNKKRKKNSRSAADSSPQLFDENSGIKMELDLKCETQTDDEIKENTVLESNSAEDIPETFEPLSIECNSVCSIVLVDRTELERLLNRTVEITEGFSVDVLCDLYTQLNWVVEKYSESYDRQLLPKELNEELDRFQKYYPL